MNFLLHHDFATAETEDAGEEAPFAAGAMLPDLWRMADRKVRPREVPVEETSSPLGAVLSGIEHHRSIDRWFHRSRVFTEGERHLRQRLFETRSTKLLLFAHPAWEMCLDGALLRERGSDAVTRAVSESLSRAETGLERAAEMHHFDSVERGPDERVRFRERMRRIVAAGKDGTLFDDYASARGIAQRLAGMRMAFGFGPPSHAELESWRRALEASVLAADAALEALREERAIVRAEPVRSETP